jgi:hypothetical protein
MGDARLGVVAGYLTYMDTGEIAGEWIQVDIAGLTPSDNKFRVLELYLPGFVQGLERVREEARKLNAPTGFDWHYRSETHFYGHDSAGHTVQWDKTSNKLTRLYSVNDRRRSVEYASRFGAAKSGRKYQIPAATIRKWTQRDCV